MSYKREYLGSIDNPSEQPQSINIPGAILVLGGAAVGTYVGVQIGGGIGAVVGALVGGFVGALAAGFIKNFRVVIHPDGRIEVEYETRGLFNF